MSFFLFRNVNPSSDAHLTNYWRSKERVEKTLRSSFRHSDAEQQAYLLKKNLDPTYLHWIVEVNSIPFCYFMALNYDEAKQKISWGYWIGEDNYLGYGALVPPMFYNFIFNRTSLKIIQAEVLFHNSAVLEMHRKMGYREVDRIVATKTHNMEAIDEIVLHLHIKDWKVQPKSLLSLRASFQVPDWPDSLWSRISTSTCHQ